MKFKFFLSTIFIFSTTFSKFLSAETFDINEMKEISLTTPDIHKIMEQILSQHAENNKMSTVVVKNSLKKYIEQFDDYRSYLLESEVKPYFQLSESDLEKIVTQYGQNNYATYENLNELFKASIERSRLIRKELENNSSLTKDALKLEPYQIQALFSNKGFAKNTAELKMRIQNQMYLLILAEKKRYGESYVSKNQSSIMETYEKRLKSFENQYLSASDKENLFVMHVLKSLAGSLDAHTEVYSPNEANDLKMHLENSFQGVGLRLQDSPEGIIVKSILAGTPAARSGLIKTDDQIIEIDGKNVTDEEVDKAVKMLQGVEGSTVTLLIKRKVPDGASIVDKLLTVKLAREKVTVDDTRVVSSFEHVGNGIVGKIVLNSFYQNDKGISSEKDVRDALEKLEKAGNLRGLILDLRENTGGFLSQAVKVAGLFISNGVIVISKYSSGEERVFRDMDGKTFYNGPLIILTSKLTASAAEIVAQSLQDYGVAIVVGDEHTYGKGTVQTQTVTQDKASSLFKVTIGKYYTVSGNTPQLKGVVADITVPGKYGYQRIGEAYLGGITLKNDQITALFNDTFKDVTDPEKKSWFLHYYVPTEQQKTDHWKEMLPTLKKNSDYRISNNKNYQTFIKKLKGEKEEVEEEELYKKRIKNFGNEDLQMMEAVNILKDMIYLEPKNLTAH